MMRWSNLSIEIVERYEIFIYKQDKSLLASVAIFKNNSNWVFGVGIVWELSSCQVMIKTDNRKDYEKSC